MFLSFFATQDLEEFLSSKEKLQNSFEIFKARMLREKRVCLGFFGNR